MNNQQTRFPLAAATIFLLLAGTVTGLRLFSYAPAPVPADWTVPPADTVPTGAVTVRFTGTTTLVFADGETTWMTDGWFSRPGLFTLLSGEIEPDLEAIARGLHDNEVDELAAVIPLHSHYDHAMDAPEVARRTGALLLGSEATANIGRGWGLPESQIRVLTDGESFQLGAFKLTPIESRHFPYADEKMVRELIDDWEIPEPLVPPVPAFDYKLGKAYMLHVEHPRGSFLIVGSAGFIPGQLTGMDVDLLFLGVGGLGSQTEEYRRRFWEETAALVHPERIVPIHWDSLVGPIQGPFTGEIRIASFFSGSPEPLRDFLLEEARNHPDISWQVLPRYQPVVIFN